MAAFRVGEFHYLGKNVFKKMYLKKRKYSQYFCPNMYFPQCRKFSPKRVTHNFDCIWSKRKRFWSLENRLNREEIFFCFFFFLFTIRPSTLNLEFSQMIVPKNLLLQNAHSYLPCRYLLTLICHLLDAFMLTLAITIVTIIFFPHLV